MTSGAAPEQREDACAVLSRVKCLMIDMDGVLFRGRTRLPGADEFPQWLAARGITFRLLTNNATATPQQNAEKLAEMGIHVEPEDVLTSAQATAAYLAGRGAVGQPAFVIGEAGLRQALLAVGIEIVPSGLPARWVVVGLDRHVNYDALQEACFAIQAGAIFIASNADTSLPVERGNAPGAGAIVAAITAVTGVRPTVIGKPESAMLLQTMAAFAVDASGCAMLGDRLDTDIDAANRLDMLSILVLTGVATQGQLAGSPIQPDLVFDGLPELMAAWENS